MGKYTPPIAVIAASDPERAARIRLREREKRRRQRESDPVRAKQASLRHYHANKETYDARSRKWKQDNPDKVRLSKRKLIEKNRPRYWVQHYRGRAKKLGVPFDLSEAWFSARLERGCCEMSDLPFDFSEKRGPNTPTVDRIKAGGGYTHDNCRLILWSINRALNNWGEDCLVEVFRRVIEKRDGRSA